jgi:hypothetical protein
MGPFRSALPAAAPSRSAIAIGIDAGLAVVVAIVTDFAIAVAAEPGSRPVDAFAYVLGAAMAGPVLGRRRWPLGALLATAVTLLVYYSVGHPGFSPAIPLAVALYSATAAGRLRWSLSVSGAFVLTGTLVLAFHREEPPLTVFTGMVQVAALLAAVSLLAEVAARRWPS